MTLPALPQALALHRLRFLTLLLVPSPAFAEVMDKEPSATALLLFGAAAGLTAFLSAKYRPRLLWLVVPLISLYFWVQFQELYDPVVGPMIRLEAGDRYFQISWVAAAMPVVGLLAGAWFRRKASHVV